MRTSARNGHSSAIASAHEATGLGSIARKLAELFVRPNSTVNFEVEEAKHSDEKSDECFLD